MRILFISHSAATYGAENCLWDILEQSHRYGWVPVVLCPADGPLVSRIRHLGIKTYLFPHFSWYSHNPGQAKRCMKWVLHRIGAAYLKQLHARHRFEIVYSNTLSSYIGALFARRNRVPHIWHLHEYLGENIPATFDRGKESSLRWMGALNGKVVFNSGTTKAAYGGWIPESLGTVIPNGLPDRFFDAFSGRAPIRAGNPFQLGIIGKLIPVKQVETAVEALAGLRGNAGEQFALNIVGDGDADYIRSLKLKADRLGVSEAIVWHGYQEDPLPFYAKLDGVLISSRLETYCRSACEAMASGCPVIVSDSGEPRRYVVEGETGYVFPVGDSAALARQIQKLKQDPVLRDHIVSQAHAYARAHWTAAAYARRIASVIEEVAGRQAVPTCSRSGNPPAVNGQKQP